MDKRLPREISDAVSSVREPESNVGIDELKLVESVDFSNNIVTVKYHCVSPFCPPLLVLATGLELKQKLLSIPAVREAKITLVNHFMSDQVNKQIAAFKAEMSQKGNP